MLDDIRVAEELWTAEDRPFPARERRGMGREQCRDAEEEVEWPWVSRIGGEGREWQDFFPAIRVLARSSTSGGR